MAIPTIGEDEKMLNKHTDLEVSNIKLSNIISSNNDLNHQNNNKIFCD